jgi:hypothetical protein
MPTPSSAERRIKRYKAIIENMKATAADTRVRYGNIVAKHVNAERNLTQQLQTAQDKILKDAFHIQELHEKEAVQAQMIGGLGQDNKELRARYTSHTRDISNLREQVLTWKENWEKADARVLDLERRWHERLWSMSADYWRLKRAAWEQFKSRVKTYWQIRRLNRERLRALEDAYCGDPERAARIAKQYWEHDRRRMSRDERVQHIIHTTHQHGTAEAMLEKLQEPSLWRKLKILLGRA